MPGDHLVQQRGVEHCACARPTLVQRRRARHQAVARHRAVGGFDADGRGQRSGLADRTAGVRPDGQRRLERGQRRRAAAAGSAGHPLDIPRIAGRAVGRVLGGRPHRELVHVGLAQNRDARGAQPHRDRRVVGRRPSLQDLRPARGRHVRGGEHVLERQRDTGQRGRQLLARGHRGIHPAGRRQRLLLRHVQERLIAAVGFGDAVQAGPGDFCRRHLLGGDLCAKGRRVQPGHVVAHASAPARSGPRFAAILTRAGLRALVPRAVIRAPPESAGPRTGRRPPWAPPPGLPPATVPARRRPAG